MKRLTTAALLALTATTAQAAWEVPTDGRPYIVENGKAGGGVIDRYVEHVAALNRAGAAVEIRGSAQSATTFYLGADRVCVGENMVLEFHGPSGVGATVFSLLVGLPSPDDFLSDAEHSRIVGLMVNHYNDAVPGLGDWFIESGASDKHGAAFSRLSAKTLNARFGVAIYGERIVFESNEEAKGGDR